MPDVVTAVWLATSSTLIATRSFVESNIAAGGTV
jgi:hypothetical protein